VVTAGGADDVVTDSGRSTCCSGVGEMPARLGLIPLTVRERASRIGDHLEVGVTVQHTRAEAGSGAHGMGDRSKLCANNFSLS
jgi:hypothetical protein